MKKELISHYVDKLSDIPDFISKNAQKFLDESGKDALDSASGAAGIILKLFAKPLLDKYFETAKDKKLEDLGYYTYLKSSIKQAVESLEYISAKKDIPFASDDVLEIVNKSLNRSKINNSDLVLVFKPTSHPIVVFIRQAYQQMLESFNFDQGTVNEFLKHFSTNIGDQIKSGFGEDYDSHIKNVREKWLRENEENFLLRMQELNKIGFSEGEKFNYETTYAKWERVSKFRYKETEFYNKTDIKSTLKEISNIEKQYEPIENLIDQYFAVEESGLPKKILFIVADFGKGKSVFLKQYASELATKYMQTGDGLFPVYFNLRDYKEYLQDSSLGVIGNYMSANDIDLNDEYYKSKDYIFLIDSLDESGELNSRNIDEVITSITKINVLDKGKYLKNRIIITSRPIEDGLGSHLCCHSPFIIKNGENRDVEHFISIYGFKMNQFNDWLINALKTMKDLSSINASGYVKTMIDSIKADDFIDIYRLFLENKILSPSELCRPIFAYMIYKLTINNVDFSKTGKIGLYLSFLNLLTKEAKPIHDKTIRINLKEEYEFRNILHSIAALWTYRRHKSGQGTLSKIDICRTIKGKNVTGNTSELLNSYKGVRDFQFLSHSYFGENGEFLYFQHQSFAEMLLAEYYLKVLIKYATDGVSPGNVELARVKLMLGEPTEQTVEFFVELLRLLNESSAKSEDAQIIEKRKLLFPLMASLGTIENNNLYSRFIDCVWYDSDDFSENETTLPEEKLKNWVITKKEINKIVELCKAIVNSDTTYVLNKSQNKDSLYDNEVSEFDKSLNNINSDMDKWLALLAGNVLVNNEQKNCFFNRDIENYESLFNLIKGWNYVNNSSSPSWGEDLFVGIDLSNNNKRIDLSHTNFSRINFSFSNLRNLDLCQCDLSGCIFRSVSFENVEFVISDFSRSVFSNISINGYFDISLSTLEQGLLIPFDLCQRLNRNRNKIYINHGQRFSAIDEGSLLFMIDRIGSVIDTLCGFIAYLVKEDALRMDEIKKWFCLYDSNGYILASTKQQYVEFWEKFNKTLISKLKEEGINISTTSDVEILDT